MNRLPTTINQVVLAILSLMFLISSGLNTGGQDIQQDIHVELVRDESKGVLVVVAGFTDSQIKLLRGRLDQDFINVWVHGVDQKEVPSMVGVVEFSGSRLQFNPGFPFKSGMKYDVHVSLPLDPVLNRIWVLGLPAIRVAPTELTAIYPTVDEVPENLLKFYIHFSAPMRKGDVYRFIHLRERIDSNDHSTGSPDFRDIELPFLEIEQEFWSVDSKRLTLLLDPGRIKRGLKPREEMGPIFESNRKYELFIDDAWPDANGNRVVVKSNSRLTKNLSKLFRTTKPDRRCPDPKRWVITAPIANTRGFLVIKFEEPLDSAMLRRVVRVHAPDGFGVTGEVELTEHESVWRFRPQSVWEPGTHEIRVDNRLEDLCGNSIAKVFDVDVFQKNEPLDSDGETVLVFVVR